LSFVINPTQQTILFGALPNVSFGALPFTVSATASSGGTVSLTSGTPAVCSVSGTTVTLVSIGTCAIVASQGGNTNYLAASITQRFQIAGSLCDIDQNGTVTVNDVQAEINEVLGTTSPGNDLNGDGIVNLVDVQIVVSAAITSMCKAL
jgi:hypothetical protein